MGFAKPIEQYLFSNLLIRIHVFMYLKDIIRGRIFMNQESKVINVHLEKRENKDYLVFGFEEVAEVCLNDDESQNNLKSIFVKLLTEITKYPIELQFLEKPEYKTGLYIDVCKEYIKDLNKEITNVRKNMPEKLKIQ